MVSFSKSANSMRSSEIRRLMALAADPSIISFSGGMPANTLFPIQAIDEIYASLPEKLKQIACQYGPTSGYPPLLEELAKYLRSKGLKVGSNNLIITTGAQQALNLLAKVFLDPGDTVVTEYPCFIGAIAAFKSYGAELYDIPMDTDGIDVAALKTYLDHATPSPKLMYISPYFHNPAGIIYSHERKMALLDVLKGRDLCLIEDDPYCELYFDESDKKQCEPLKAIATDNEPVPICYVGTFAKIFGPGMRLGWLLAPEDIIAKCELAKQSQDACSATFTQVLAHQFLAQQKMPEYLDMLRIAYARRAKIMDCALQENMPDGVTWTTPRGGFFIWVTLPERINSSDVFNEALKNGAAFVIGNAFDPQARRNNSMRLAFSNTPEDKIATGIRIIANAVKSLL